MTTNENMMAPENRESDWKRYVPIAVIAVGFIAGYVFLRDFLSFQALEENYQALLAWRDQNWLIAGVTFMAIYVLAVAFSIPGAIWLTMLAGFLFGIPAGATMVVVAATLGATCIFLAARTSLGALLKEKAGDAVARLEGQFREGEISFLLIMRLVPVIPFFIANLAPAFLGAKLSNFIWTTLVGIIPGTLVFISIGAGLGEQLERGEAPDLGVIFELHVLGPLLGLAALAALPILLKKLGVTKRS